MSMTFPGTCIECSKLEVGCSRVLFDGVFATGGITLSQVCIMTGLEPYLVQNWVKRGFVTSPKARVYSRQQLARVIIINMLRQSLQIDKICGLIKVISGVPDDTSDDLIMDNELYHLYVDMLAKGNINISDEKSVERAVMEATKDFREPTPGAAKQLRKILSIMLYAHSASQLSLMSDQILSTL